MCKHTHLKKIYSNWDVNVTNVWGITAKIIVHKEFFIIRFVIDN